MPQRNLAILLDLYLARPGRRLAALRALPGSDQRRGHEVAGWLIELQDAPRPGAA